MPSDISTLLKPALKKREIAYEQFSGLLLKLQIKPGQFLTQRQLAKITDMPLGAIRELIPRLEADGLIKTIPQRGLQVTYVDMNLIRNAFELRLVLETHAAREFTRNASDRQIADLRREHEEILAGVTGEPSQALLEKAQQTDWRFHEMMIDALDNEIISDIYRVNSIKVRLIRLSRSRIGAHDLQRVFSEHLAIISAMRDRDEKRAVEALSAHITEARTRAFSD